jgi:hypothetical protein
MPILSNPKHETFAQLLAQNKTAREAYVLSGYRDNRHNAARLKSSEHVKARVLEMQMAGAKSAEISVASLLQELEDARAKATSLGQLSAAVRAISEKGKLAGLTVEKQQIEVVNTEYEAQSTTEVFVSVLERVGEKAARALAAAFEIEFPEEILSPASGANGSQASARAVEWLPPKADRKRQVG